MVDRPESSLQGIVVGLGTMGSHHLRVLGSLPEVEIRAVVDLDPDLREARLRAHPAIRGYAALEDALELDGLDFACLAVPVDELPNVATSAIAHGLHVFVEKPMAPTEDRARRLIAAAAERDVVLAVGFVERFNPAVIALKEKLDAGAVGEILQMHARRLSPFPNRGGTGGVALDLATHDIDVMRYLSGAEVERVSGETLGQVRGGGEDLICATLRFDSGATGLLEANWITPTKVRELSVLGERGMFVVNYLTQDLTFYGHPTRPTEWDALAGMRGGGEGDMIRFALTRREPLTVQWEAFLDAVRTGTKGTAQGRDGLAALSSAIAIQRAGSGHEVVAPHHKEAPVA
jgi:UDP-N-acetylglucosamine 3-dehydrogenase